MKRIYKILLIVIVFQVFLFYYFRQPPRDAAKTIYRISGDTLDYSGQYRVIRFYRGEGVGCNYSFHDVSLATQCSVNHLHHLVELLERWDGPVSCSVFVPSQDASYADDSILLLRRCFPKIRRHVTFHLVFPTSHPADMAVRGSWLDLGCDDLLYKLENYGYQNYDVAGISFPHNVLRNAARTGVLTQYVLLVDIDVMPNVGLRSQFIDFAIRNNLFDMKVKDKIAYVVPVFEVLKGLEFPKQKKQLLEGTIQLDVEFTAEWDKSWEPFYIARRSVPMFDERFKQYGFDRIQQICEMHIAGYKFSILNNAFLTHHGWKYQGRFYAKKDFDNAQNWILFNYHFKDDLQSKYNSNLTCSPIESWKPGQKRGALVAGRGMVNNRFKGRVHSNAKVNKRLLQGNG